MCLHAGGRADNELTARDDAAAHTRAERDQQQVVSPAHRRFTERGAVGVVAECHSVSDAGCDEVGKRRVGKGQICRADVPVRRDDAGRTHADRLCGMGGQQLLCPCRRCVGDRLGACFRRLHGCPRDDAVCRVHHAEFNVGSPDVDSEIHPCLRPHPGRCGFCSFVFIIA